MRDVHTLLQYKIYKHKKIIILYVCFRIKSNVFVILGLRHRTVPLYHNKLVQMS